MDMLLDFVKLPVQQKTSFVRNALGNVTWGPALTLSRATATSMFSRFKNGQLIIVDEVAGTTDIFGCKSADGIDKNNNNIGTSILKVELRVKRETFWVRLFLFADMGFAESYMLGEVTCSNLTSFFELFILNRKHIGSAATWTSSLLSTISGLARSTNTLVNAMLNASAHYDLSNDMFSAFLSEDMTYSSAIWSLESDNETLEEAQMRKLNRHIDGAKIKASDHVLEIGTGWGSFAIQAVRRTGCRITTLTLSVEQKALAEERVAAAGYSDRIKVKLMDYRALYVEVPFDKIVSIEMLEHVGREYLDTYFECVHRLLKSDGIATFQCSTISEARYEAYSRSEDFIRRYIFPNGHLPSIGQLVASISNGSEGTLIIERVENISGHYCKTLRLWKEKFAQNYDSIIRPALMAQHKGMDEKEAEVFRRKWEYYFSYSEAAFATKTLGDVIIIVGREGAMELMEQIPL